MVYEVTNPKSHSTIRITQIVQSILPTSKVIHVRLVKRASRLFQKSYSQLFHTEVIFHFCYSRNAAGNFTSLIDILCRIDKTA